jgi:hypothetical protein
MSARARARADARFFFPPGLAPVAGFPSFLPFFSPLVLPTLRPTPLPTPPTSAKASRALWLRSVWTFRGADGGSRGTPTQSGDLCRVYSRLKVTRWVCSCPLPPSPHPPPPARHPRRRLSDRAVASRFSCSKLHLAASAHTRRSGADEQRQQRRANSDIEDDVGIIYIFREVKIARHRAAIASN